MDKPRLVLRDEDIKADTKRKMLRLVEFLGLSTDPMRLALAIKQSGFEHMRAMEVREKVERRNGVVFPGPPPRQGWPRYFMNSGKVGSTLAHIDPDLDRAFDDRFQGLNELLGYSPSPSPRR